MMDSPLTFTSGEVSGYYAARVPHLNQRRATQWRGACPIHHGTGNSFAVSAATGRWFCHSQCGQGGDIISLEMALTGGAWRDAVAEVERIIARRLLDPPRSLGDRAALVRRYGRERREMREAEFFRIAAEFISEHILEELPEAVPERFAPAQLILRLRKVRGPALLALYHDWRTHEPRLTAGLAYAGERAWYRLCTRVARFVVSGAGVTHGV